MSDKNKPMTLFDIPIIVSDNVPDNHVMLVAPQRVTIPLEVEIQRNDDDTGNLIVMKPKAKRADD